MIPASQEVLIVPHPPLASQETLLTEAFSEFIAASARLELSYRDLQTEVADLSQTLAERNRALSESLSANRSIGVRLQSILETIPCGVLVVGEDGTVQLANPEAARLLALSAGDTMPDSAVPPAPNLQLDLLTLPATAEEGEQEIFVDGPEGRVWIALRRVLLPAASPTLTRKTEVVLTLRDISARKRMEQEREAARDAVALAQVSALLAHEIRNPLASLELFAGLIEEDTDRRGEWLSHLRAGIRSLSGTVNNVLTLHGNTALTLESVDLLRETALAVDFLQPLARQAEVHLRFRADDVSARARAHGNRAALHQILMNLCANALRHTPKGGTVEVLCAQGSHEGVAVLRIAVRDTGCGIPADQMPHLFEVGFSGSGSTSGLGLAVCDRLARQMQATLAVQSCVGQGSTFTLEMVQR